MQYIPVVEIFAFLELEQKLPFFKGLLIIRTVSHQFLCKIKVLTIDGVVKSLIYCAVAVFKELDILYRIVSSLKNHYAFLSR